MHERSSVFARASALSGSSSAARAAAERQPLLSGAPPPQVFVHPIECASLTSRLLLQWVTPSITLANRPQANSESHHQPRRPSRARGLHQADVWELPPRARAEPEANALQCAWIASGSLLLAFVKAHGLKYMGLGLLHALVQLCDLLGPYVLFRSVLLLQEQEDEVDSSEKEIVHGLLFWLGALMLSKLLRALLSAFVRTELQTTTLRLTAALRSLVFQKALRLPNPSSQKTDSHYATDVAQLLQGAACLHDLWASPLLLAMSLMMIAKLIGPAACGAAAGAALCTLALSQGLSHLSRQSCNRLRRTREDRQIAANDMVRAMPAVKLHAWEVTARAYLNTTREREIEALWRFHVLGAAGAAVNFAMPMLVTTAALAVGYRSTTHLLTPAVAFTTLALVRLMQMPLRTLPETAIGVHRSWRALCNLSRFMDEEEMDLYAVAHRDNLGWVGKYDPQDVVVAIEDATLGWSANGPLLFQHLDMTVGAGELLVVHGRPKSGKSSFLAALLGEMQTRGGSDGVKGSGRVYVGGSVAYCPQQPWLQQALSVRDNVMFGLAYDRRKYQRVLDACALVDTFAMLPAGDHTLIRDWRPGPEQQALISLARACYSDADVYLLDESLAKVRPSLERDIFSRCLLGLLCNKTRVVVTTRPEFINSEFVDDAIRFEDGGRLIHTRDVFDTKGCIKEKDDQMMESTSWAHHILSGADAARSFQPKEKPTNAELMSMENIVTTTRVSMSERPVREYLLSEPTADAQCGEDHWLYKAIRAYAHAVGGVRVAMGVFVALLFWQVMHQLSEVWVAWWVRPSAPSSFSNGQIVYVSLALSTGLLALGYTMGIAMTAVEGSRRVFSSLADAFLHAPLVFFDAYGAGSGRSRSKKLSLARRRELERAFTARDLNDLDIRLPLAIGAMLAIGGSISMALLIAVTVTRLYALLLAPVLYMCAHTARSYLRPARDLFLLERMTQQSARVHVAEALNGARVVRAFGLAHAHRVLSHHFWLLDIASRDAHLGLHVDQWLALRVQIYGAVIVGLVAGSVFLALRHTLNTGLLALALYEALVVDGGGLESAVRAWAWLSPVVSTAVRTEAAVRGTEVITANAAYSMAAAKRGSAPLTPVYTEINPSLSWPMKGDLRFDAVSFRDPAAATPDDIAAMFEVGDSGAPPLSLKGVSFRLQAGEKVAILESSVTSSVSSVGRALLRVHELTAGRIVVDGVDIATLGLRTLRSRVACVSAATPNAALYDGSVRMQLNPSSASIEDERLWAVLRAVGLSSDVVTLDGQFPDVAGLRHRPSSRFLLSLARALLSEASVVLLALAPVLVLPPEDDMQLHPDPLFALDDATAAALQRVIHEELHDATVLLLLPSSDVFEQEDQAQRSMLLKDVDRVLAVIDGEMAELSTPAKLVAMDQANMVPAEAPGKLELSDLEHSSESVNEVRIPDGESVRGYESGAEGSTESAVLIDGDVATGGETTTKSHK